MFMHRDEFLQQLVERVRPLAIAPGEKTDGHYLEIARPV